MNTERVCKTLLDHTEEIVILFDAEGRILYGNPSACQKLNYTEENLKKRSMADFFRQEFQQSGSSDTAVFCVDSLRKEETVMYRKKTSCFPVKMHILDMEPGEYMLLAQDMTWEEDVNLRIRQMKEEEKVNLQMRDEFTANVTHELRTPVNGIRGHVGSIIDNVTDAEIKKTLEMVLYCCDNISAIINNILDFSKIKANKFLLEEREFDFYDMMEHVVAVHMPQINKKELGLNVTVNPGVPRFVVGDSLRIEQILNNLLSNAVKFTKVGKVEVDVAKTYQSNDVIELFFMVRDSGIGISPEDQDKLFQSFTQVDASVTRNFGGTGLGLAITRQLVELMGGTIRVDSEKGKGSCFSFNVRLHTGQKENAKGDADAAIRNSWNNLSIGGAETDEEEMYLFGSQTNRKEIQKRMEKLVLSMELASWDKAEMLIDTIKALVGEPDAALKRLFLRLEMAIRKENYEGSMESYEKLKAALEETMGNVS